MQKIKIKYVGEDGWCRCVFKDDNGNYYKTIALIPLDDGFKSLSVKDKLDLLRSLHTTSDFEGEPNWPCWNPDKFDLVEDFGAL